MDVEAGPKPRQYLGGHRRELASFSFRSPRRNHFVILFSLGGQNAQGYFCPTRLWSTGHDVDRNLLTCRDPSFPDINVKLPKSYPLPRGVDSLHDNDLLSLYRNQWVDGNEVQSIHCLLPAC